MTRSAERRRAQRQATALVRWAVVLGGMLMAIAILTFGLASRPQRAAIEVTGQPRLKVDREVIDLGDVPLGRPVQVAFVLTNVGDRPLRLTEAPSVEVVEGC